MWPLSGWSNSPEHFPIVSSTVLLNHLMKTAKCIPGSKDMVVVQKSLKRRYRGYDFFFWGYIDQVELQLVDGIWYVQSQCWASQCKSTKYHQKLTLISQRFQGSQKFKSETPTRMITRMLIHMNVYYKTHSLY